METRTACEECAGTGVAYIGADAMPSLCVPCRGYGSIEQRGNTMSLTSKERQDTYAELEKAGVPHDVTRTLMWHASRLSRLNEDECNVEMTDRQQERHDKKVSASEKRIVDLLKPYGLRVEWGGDPRGYSCKVFLPSGRSNSWSGEGWGIG